jgi:hypothetical protein
MCFHLGGATLGGVVHTTEMQSVDRSSVYGIGELQSCRVGASPGGWGLVSIMRVRVRVAEPDGSNRTHKIDIDKVCLAETQLLHRLHLSTMMSWPHS